MERLIYWIWLSLSVTPGSVTFKKLIDKYNDVEAIYELDREDLESVIGSRSKDLNSLSDKDLKGANDIYEFCTTKGVGILTYEDKAFPKSLREISEPPVLLYYRGILPDFNKSCIIAMVGTRRLTDYGRRNAFQIGYDLGSVGAVIASGMAVGIDGVSHAGSLSAGGINIAFLGSGIDVCYPKDHKYLAREIVKSGCVMTEYAPGTKPDGYNFPVRNRLIAGIACATVVIEGREKSGAIITARSAKKQGKTVYALPGNVDNKTSEVTNLLIKNGAKLITSAVDIISDQEFAYPGIINPYELKKRPDFMLEESLVKYKVACVTPGDPIFSRRSRRKNLPEEKNLNDESESKAVKSNGVDEKNSKINEDISGLNFDKDTLEIYKRIPIEGECDIEELTDSDYTMPFVMRSLLKLEMGCFVTMLPGEKVKRNHS